MSGGRLEGCFYEISEDANAYRAEQLGLAAIHHLLAALSKFYELEGWRTKAGCDNEGAIKISRRRPRRIRLSMRCVDILRNIRSSRNRMTVDPDYFHVYGHMDDYLDDSQLTSEQHLNKRCNTLAKEAVNLAVKLRSLGHLRKQLQLSLNESTAVLVGGVKIAGDVADAVRYAKGLEEAKTFLMKEMGWSEEKFDAVDWRNLHMTLKSKLNAYRTWLSKQHSGTCGTRVRVGYYSRDDDADVGCPNCGCEEKAEHLCVCMDDDRTRSLNEMTDSLSCWLSKGDKTDAELAYYIPKYVLARGTIRFQDLGMMSPEVRLLAEEQDLIGWQNFIDGRISRKFGEVQSKYLAVTEGHLNGRDWVRGLLSCVLQLTHSQWLYRNMTLHDKAGGSLRNLKIEQMRSKVENLACTDPSALPEESRFLLELDGERYVKGDANFRDNVYWMMAMKAAVVAGRRNSRASRRRSRMSQELERSRVAALAATKARIVREVRRDMEDLRVFPFVTSDVFRQYRTVVGEDARVAQMRSNRRYNPGD